MSKKVRMLTVVPANLATELAQKKKIKDYNTLPQVNQTVLRLVRECMIERIGYRNLPMACLSGVRTNMSGEDISSYLPVSGNGSVVFLLEMPDDMFLSVSFSELLDISSEAAQLSEGNDFELELLRERLQDAMVLGCDSSIEDPISFIPFLDMSKCQRFAKLDKDFKAENLNIPGVVETSVRELSSFVN